MDSDLTLNVQELSPFQLRVAIIAAELAREVENECAGNVVKCNGVLEIRVSRSGRSFDKSFHRNHGNRTFGVMPTYQ